MQHTHKITAPRTILICSIRFIGDVILTTPLIGILKDAYPDAAIDVIVGAETGSFLTRDPRIRSVIEAPSREVGKRYSNARHYALLGRIFRSYDMAITMNASDRGNIAVLCAGTRERIGFFEHNGYLKNFWKRLLLTKPLLYNTSLHSARYCQRVAEALGIHVTDLQAKVYWDNDDAAAVRRLTDAPSAENPYFVIHPFARWDYKYWSMESFVELSDRIAKRFGLRPVWSASPDPRELELLDAYVPRCNIRPLTIRGTFSLNQMACLIAGSRLYIGLDTAISHIAATTNVPMVALYGPTSTRRWFPWNNQGPVDQLQDCERGVIRNGNIILMQKDCLHPGCIRERCNRPCMLRITPVEVFDAAAQLLMENDFK